MSFKPIIVVAGEPNSVFFEIFFKALKKKKIKSPIILIASFKLLKLQMKKMGFRKEINLITTSDLRKKLSNKSINLFNINFNQKKPFEKISSRSNNYINKSFDIALKILKMKITNKLLNGPVSKKYFLKKNFLGVTEYLANKNRVKKYAMLIYNKNLSVSPITTHLPLKQVSNNISKRLIKDKINLINQFYKKFFKKKPNIAVTGLNPHCESVDNFNEDQKIIKPTVYNLIKSGYKINGPFAADTIFQKKNRQSYDVIVGMYHDQVLAPIKTLFEFNAINITLGLPFIRVSPDHGPNEKMLGKKISNPQSLIESLTFLDF